MAAPEHALVIAALSDPGRRALLDALRERNGQSVSDLGDVVPHLGRHAVLKHVGLLEEAHLVTTRKVGRQRLCFLNPVPIVDLAQRWLTDFSAAWGHTLLALRDTAHTPGGPMSGTTPAHVFTVLISAARERVWHALVTEESAQWFFGTTPRSDFAIGSAIVWEYADGRPAADGEILAYEEGRLLDTTFRPLWDEAARAVEATRTVWRLDDTEEGFTRVTLEHHGLTSGHPGHDDMAEGSLFLVSNLKTWIETGAQMQPA